MIVFFHPGPGLVVEIHEVLIVKMDAWKFLFGHRVSLGNAQRQYNITSPEMLKIPGKGFLCKQKWLKTHAYGLHIYAIFGDA
jgi:hypothetical protein